MGGIMMTREDQSHVHQEELEIAYRELRGAGESSSCCAEIVFSSGDRVIIDEMNIERLARKLSDLLPAMVSSRALKGQRTGTWAVAGW